MLHAIGSNTLTSDDLRYIARTYHGDKGEFAYRAWDHINATLFDCLLPLPLIQWSLTPHGGCLGLTIARRDAPPVITLHPSLLGGTQKPNPWGVPSALLGVCYAYDVLVHEAIHVSVRYVIGYEWAKGETSHNNAAWVGEVNRLAPLLDMPGIEAGQSKVKRVSKTRVARVAEGTMPFRDVATFPKRPAFYAAGVLPFEVMR